GAVVVKDTAHAAVEAQLEVEILIDKRVGKAPDKLRIAIPEGRCVVRLNGQAPAAVDHLAVGCAQPIGYGVVIYPSAGLGPQVVGRVDRIQRLVVLVGGGPVDGGIPTEIVPFHDTGIQGKFHAA